MDELAKLKETWNKKYPMVIGSWENNWPKLSTYFNYPAGIRKLIYTTNTIEGYLRLAAKDYLSGQNEDRSMILSRKKEAAPCSLYGADTASFKLGHNCILPVIH
jgi:Transposase, Mutator family